VRIPWSDAFHGVVMKALDGGKQAGGPDRKFASTQVEANGPVVEIATALMLSIPESDRASDKDLPSYAHDLEPHITALYGLHDDDPEPVRRVVGDFGPIHARVGGVSAFANPGTPYEVLKLDIDSPDLRRMHALMASRLKNTQTHPEYVPHLTIAYLKPGAAKKYTGDSPWAKAAIERLRGRDMWFKSLVFSPVSGDETAIPLSKTKIVAKPAYPALGE